MAAPAHAPGGQGGADELFASGFLADVFAERPAEDVITRFPPEPNGYLHMGHSKAIATDFGFARYHNGECNLRFDDTNPNEEEPQFFTAIEEIVAWLGFTPTRVTYSSDSFDRLYEIAESLIQSDYAYVCHCSQDEVKAARGVVGDSMGGERYACVHRSRPTSESLNEFRAMRDGNYGPGEAFLRLKQNIEDPNPQMWDVAAYRILKPPVGMCHSSPHHRTGSKWKIYPTYDFTHCLCDSFEGITHSLCTTEFELSRQSYEWLCHKVDVYCPMQREFGRLVLEGTVLSKRGLKAIVNGGHVRGWDDPRLYTLIALRRRGAPPGAILSFVNDVGVSKAKTTIQVTKFEQSLRKYLETTVPRLMLVLDPIPIVIDNLPEGHCEMVDVPFSKDPSHGSHQVPFTQKVYIDRSDFREIDSKDYFRLAPGKAVGLLRVPYPIIATSFEKDSNSGLVTVVHADYVHPDENGKFKKPKTYIQWVADSPTHNSPIRATSHIYNSLFTIHNPSQKPELFLPCLNPKSEEVYPNSMIEVGFHEIQRRAPWPAREGEMGVQAGNAPPETVRFQGLRTAYYCVDKDSTPDHVVLNRIVSLKEDVGKTENETGKDAEKKTTAKLPSRTKMMKTPKEPPAEASKETPSQSG